VPSVLFHVVESTCNPLTVRAAFLFCSLRLRPAEYEKLENPAVTHAAENSCTNRIIGVICPFLPPRVFAKCLPIRRMVGRGGGDRTIGAIEAAQVADSAKRQKRKTLHKRRTEVHGRYTDTQGTLFGCSLSGQPAGWLIVASTVSGSHGNSCSTTRT